VTAAPFQEVGRTQRVVKIYVMTPLFLTDGKESIIPKAPVTRERITQPLKKTISKCYQAIFQQYLLQTIVNFSPNLKTSQKLCKP
jgi:hypothetical protein